MNYPGNPSGNWTWRMPEDALSEELLERIREFNFLYERGKRDGAEADMTGGYLGGNLEG
jgi:4-alpha-glucanotransferase